MGKVFVVRVVEDFRWSTVRVGGRNFSKGEGEEINEADVTEEIRGSPLLEVEEVAGSQGRRVAKSQGAKSQGAKSQVAGRKAGGSRKAAKGGDGG